MIKKTMLLTGGTGVLGKEIVSYLILENFHVRILTRDASKYENSQNITYIHGDILNTNSIEKAINGCYGIIHAAGEKKEISRMKDTNVTGTINVCNIANSSSINYFCYVSSVGVIGLTNKNIITEDTDCHPTNFYEKTKLQAENYVLNHFKKTDCASVILRPTNVFSKPHLNFKNSFFDVLKRRIKGNEIANYVYVKDVAFTCVFFCKQNHLNREIFIVNDAENKNTFKNIEAITRNKKLSSIYAPIFIPYLFRFIKFGKNNKGNKYYSSKKLLTYKGFKFPYGLEAGIYDTLKNNF